MNTNKLFIPKFPLPEGFESADRYLAMLTMQGAQRRYPESEQYTREERLKIHERIESELGVIAEVGCADYFLVMCDALQYARQKGILIGPGRGSAAGSIVNYCLGITQVDPLKHDLLFERFFNTNRSFYPCADIDIDIDGDERLYEEMLCYLPIRYGKNHVARIANNPCGIVISSEDITKYFATSYNTNRDGVAMLTIEADIRDIEDAGFLKFDFITFDVLTNIRRTLELIKLRSKHYIDLTKIPLDDNETLNIYNGGQTEHTFGFASNEMRRILQQVTSVTFADLVALNALYRPGPMEWISKFISCKRNKTTIKHHIAEVNTCLSETYGILVYQEQTMMLAQRLAGFIPNESDRLRKVLGKWNNMDAVARMKETFLRATMDKGYNSIHTAKLWKDIELSGRYQFNKSHAVCYTLIAFQTVYLKAHFPMEYMFIEKMHDIQ